MSGEPQKPEQNTGEWVMPEPVFRSSEGFTPKTAVPNPDDDIPTEPGFSDDFLEADTEAPNVAGAKADAVAEDENAQHVWASTKTRVRHHKKRTGCAKTFGVIAGAVALSLATIVLVLLYFVFYYRPAGSSF